MIPPIPIEKRTVRAVLLKSLKPEKPKLLRSHSYILQRTRTRAHFRRENEKKKKTAASSRKNLLVQSVNTKDIENNMTTPHIRDSSRSDLLLKFDR